MADELLDPAQEMYLELLLDAGCKARMRTELFGKQYVWMTSPHGTYFLEALPEVRLA